MKARSRSVTGALVAVFALPVFIGLTGCLPSLRVPGSGVDPVVYRRHFVGWDLCTIQLHSPRGLAYSDHFMIEAGGPPLKKFALLPTYVNISARRNHNRHPRQPPDNPANNIRVIHPAVQ